MTVAARVNNRCSNPVCRAPTSGPQVDPTKALNIGVAAHITAASPGGPRYDPQLSSAERRHATNAIWLCQNCAKLIDNDPKRFSAVYLQRCKAAAEATALKQLHKSNAFQISSHVSITDRSRELALQVAQSQLERFRWIRR